MVHEEFIGGQFGGLSGAAEGRPSGPTVLEPGMFAEAILATSTPTPARGQPVDTVPVQAPAAQPRLRPWQAAARAKGRFGYFLAKRCLDFSLALVSLVILSPVFLVIALMVRFTSRGPAFYRQERIGYAGRPFVMYKFRSMYTESDESLHRIAYEQFLRGERASGKVDGELLTAAQPTEDTLPDKKGKAKAKRQPVGDPRVTRVGNVLRRTSLDELPQLLNVLRGDMSMVGPRPPIPYEVGLYETRHLGRLDTLPGITGYWQVSGRGRVTFGRMIDMDLEYIQKQSFWYDVKWLLLTIPAVLSRKGAA